MKQPRAIIPIFFTELWERFGYYSIQGLLVLYLITYLDFTDAYAFATLGEFLSWIYIAPVFGGWIADRILGYRYSVLIGAILLGAGYALLMTSGHLLLHLSLAIIIIGNGLLKPNSPSFLGLFYYYDDPRRYPGFTFYFTGINVGGLVAILIANLASRFFGYSGAYAIAAVGMLIAIVVYIYGFRFYENRGLPIPQQPLRSLWLRALSNRYNLFLLLLILIQAIHFLLHSIHISTLILLLVAVGVFFSLFYVQTHNTKNTHNKLIAIMLLTSTSVVFWALNLQIFFSMILFTDRYVERTFFDFQIPASFFVILEPGFLLILGPLLGNLWQKLSERNKEPNPIIKFALGLITVAIAMGLMAIATYTVPSNQLISPVWLFVFYALMTTGAIFITPTGMAMITQLAPTHLTGFMMGVWYMVIGLGGLLASLLARLTIQDPMQALSQPVLLYEHAFVIYAVIALLVSAFLFLISPYLKKLVHSQF